VGIIGCGLIGRKRALALADFPGDRLVAVCSRTPEPARRFAREFGCRDETDWRRVIEADDVDAVIVAPINAVLKPVTIAALRLGKPVLCEKPLGLNVREAAAMVRAARSSGVALMTGFNKRFHPAVRKAKASLDRGAIGAPLTIRSVFGHGARAGLEREWLSSRRLAGGGALRDLGSHVIDLTAWFGGPIVSAWGTTETLAWDIGVEDYAAGLLTTRAGISASFQVGWLNWRNTFSFEVFGTDGYLAVRGLGGGYGLESLEWGRRNRRGGRPVVKTWTFPDENRSWTAQWAEFRSAIHARRDPVGDGEDGLRAQQVVEAVYRSSKTRRAVTVRGTVD
jgi:predicted dehydrogenase